MENTTQHRWSVKGLFNLFEHICPSACQTTLSNDFDMRPLMSTAENSQVLLNKLKRTPSCKSKIVMI